MLVGVSGQGKITKEFLESAQKKSPEEAKSLGGILIQEDEDIKT